ncbi:acetyltransferase, GNAT family [Lachnospiraceae bacterium KM106-2]|nr:acetyltransferase, GNAT family [Lachnospiraceae bacterium KM106-2]
MEIRDYTEEDEQEWIRCRVVSFLDCSYFNDVKREKETYEKEAICLVAIDQDKVVGLIDVELDSADLACAGDKRGAIIWNLAVLPEYRREGVARKLWEEVKKRLFAKGIHYCELWTQEDEPANRFYQSVGFHLEESQCWLRCYSHGQKAMGLVDQEKTGKIYDVEDLVFETTIARKEEVKDFCYRMDEVRLYAGDFS